MKTALENLANAERTAQNIVTSRNLVKKLAGASTAMVLMFFVLGGFFTLSTTAKVAISDEVKLCIETDSNPVLVELRKMQHTDAGAKLALQEMCRQMVEAK